MSGKLSKMDYQVKCQENKIVSDKNCLRIDFHQVNLDFPINKLNAHLNIISNNLQFLDASRPSPR